MTEEKTDLHPTEVAFLHPTAFGRHVNGPPLDFDQACVVCHEPLPTGSSAPCWPLRAGGWAHQACLLAPIHQVRSWVAQWLRLTDWELAGLLWVPPPDGRGAGAGAGLVEQLRAALETPEVFEALAQLELPPGPRPLAPDSDLHTPLPDTTQGLLTTVRPYVWFTNPATECPLELALTRPLQPTERTGLPGSDWYFAHVEVTAEGLSPKSRSGAQLVTDLATVLPRTELARAGMGFWVGWMADRLQLIAFGPLDRPPPALLDSWMQSVVSRFVVERLGELGCDSPFFRVPHDTYAPRPLGCEGGDGMPAWRPARGRSAGAHGFFTWCLPDASATLVFDAAEAPEDMEFTLAAVAAGRIPATWHLLHDDAENPGFQLPTPLFTPREVFDRDWIATNRDGLPALIQQELRVRHEGALHTVFHHPPSRQPESDED